MTPKQQLASLKLGRPVANYIAEQRDLYGLSFSRIAADLRALGVDVSHETVRTWAEES